MALGGGAVSYERSTPVLAPSWGLSTRACCSCDLEIKKLSLPDSTNGSVLRVTPVNVIRTSIYDNYSGSIKITTHLNYISHC